MNVFGLNSKVHYWSFNAEPPTNVLSEAKLPERIATEIL